MNKEARSFLDGICEWCFGAGCTPGAMWLAVQNRIDNTIERIIKTIGW